MAYTLYAVIAHTELLKETASSFLNAHVIALKQGLSLIPVTDNFYQEVTGEESLGGISETFDRFHSDIARWVQRLSTNGAIAYVEAEFLGGEGGQSATVWKNGEEIMPPIQTLFAYNAPVSPDYGAINQALRFLDISCDGHKDEFEAIGLYRHRWVDDWIKELEI